MFQFPSQSPCWASFKSNWAQSGKVLQGHTIGTISSGLHAHELDHKAGGVSSIVIDAKHIYKIKNLK